MMRRSYRVDLDEVTWEARKNRQILQMQAEVERRKTFSYVMSVWWEEYTQEVPEIVWTLLKTIASSCWNLIRLKSMRNSIHDLGMSLGVLLIIPALCVYVFFVGPRQLRERAKEELQYLEDTQYPWEFKGVFDT